MDALNVLTFTQIGQAGLSGTVEIFEIDSVSETLLQDPTPIVPNSGVSSFSRFTLLRSGDPASSAFGQADLGIALSM